VNPAKTSTSSEPCPIHLDRYDERTHNLAPAEGREITHRESIDGVFVGADGKSIAVTKGIWHHTFEAVDPNDAEAVKTASDMSNASHDYSYIHIQDPEDPTLWLMPNHAIGNGFYVLKLDASGEEVASVDVSHPWNVKSASIKFSSDSAEDLIGDPFEVARRTLDFAKGATLKPAIPAAPVPTPTS
jgi:hypothetical protein